jgi:predicted MPP superfamily phosphohydrolase
MPKHKGANLAVTRGYTAGLYEKNDSRLFVTVGVGAWFPLRVNCPAEVALITAITTT